MGSCFDKLSRTEIFKGIYLIPFALSVIEG